MVRRFIPHSLCFGELEDELIATLHRMAPEPVTWESLQDALYPHTAPTDAPTPKFKMLLGRTRTKLNNLPAPVVIETTRRNDMVAYRMTRLAALRLSKLISENE